MNTSHMIIDKLMILLAMTGIITILLIFISPKVDAAPVSGFNAGRIIDDAVFTNKQSMSAANIQSFLNSKVPACDTWGAQPSEFGGGTRRQWAEARGHYPPYTCLKDYNEGGRSAAQIIYDTSQYYEINPQVLIVLLQKEQGLVTDTWPLSTQYRTATGYGCPDTAPCDSQYYGLTNQLGWAARMFRAIINNNPNWYTPYVLGNNYIRWNPSTSCGGSNVNIENRSTQALYNYTPYRPNQAALNAGYGMGDSCSAYGNRNFYLYFTDWFGSTQFPQPAGISIYRHNSTGVIYLVSDNVKYQVPDWNMMQNYGLDIYPSIPATDATLATFDSGAMLSNLQWDNNGVYLVNNGTRYPVPGAMCTEWNLPCFDSTKVMAFNSSFQTQHLKQGINLTNVIHLNRVIYKVSSGTKQPVANPQSLKDSGLSSTPVIALSKSNDTLPLGTPIVTTPGITKFSPKNKIYYFDGASYYLVPDMGVFDDYRLSKAVSIAIPISSYNQSNVDPPSTVLTSWVTKNDGSKLLVDQGRKLIIPTGLQGAFSANQFTPTYPTNLVESLPSEILKEHIWSYPKQYVIKDDKKRYVPTHYDYQALGASSSNQSVINISKLTNTPESDHIFGNGKTVRLEENGNAIYIVNGSQLLYIPNEGTFNGLGLSWSNIATYKLSDLQSYVVAETNIDTTFRSTEGSVYIISGGKAYQIPKQFVNDFGVNSNLTTTYEAGVASRVKPQPISRFMRSSANGAIYYASGSAIHHIQSMSAFYRYGGGSATTVIPLTNEALNFFTIGAPLS